MRYLAVDLGTQGVRVNAISAGAVKTLAASGIGGFGKMLKAGAIKAPLKRNVTLEDVGKVFNVTRERIRQIEAKALRKLRHPSRSKQLKDFIED